MGRTKNYLRFVHHATFGIVASSQSGAAAKFVQLRGTNDRYLAVPANDNVLIWDLKTKSSVSQLSYEASEVTTFECFQKLIAVGYSNGHVRVFDYETNGLRAQFVGHRTAISSLAFDLEGQRLATGGKDTNIVLWDIMGEQGLFSLKGHKNLISHLAFIRNAEYQRDLLISSSIDPLSSIKIWDLGVQHCFCTIPLNGVWSFVTLNGGTHVVTGSASPELKVFSLECCPPTKIKLDPNEDTDDVESTALEFGVKIEHLGTILRNTQSSSSRVQDLTIDEEKSLIVCNSGDHVEFYGIRAGEAALAYARKRVKKATRKRKKENPDGDQEPQKITSLKQLEQQDLVDCLFNRKLGSRKLSDKVKAVAVADLPVKDGARRYKLAVVAASNKVDSYIFEPANEDPEKLLRPLTSIESLSHRSDVRALDISSDNCLVMSASAESVKIWRLDSQSCIATIETDYAACCTFANAQNITANFENRFALLGARSGVIQILDIAAACVVKTVDVCDDGKPVTSLCVLPDRSGVACGSEDGTVRFFNFVWQNIQDGGQRVVELSLEEGRKLTFQEGVTCVKVSANGNLVAAALLDSTVRVHFVDTFKYFLTMYGHKFPVTAMDISDDNNLLITGSPDKNIKIWGLDFGDCHKSIFAHDEAITCVKFVPKTHHAFSCSRDKAIKQWDCDHFIRIQALQKHHAEIWCMGISPNGKFVVTGSHDKSIRVYRKTDEILVPSEEEDTERELADEVNVFEKQENIIVGETNLEVGFAAKMTIDTVKSTDRLIEALDVFGMEQDKDCEHKRLCEIAQSKGQPMPEKPTPDPLLMTAMTNDYHRFMLEVLRRIRLSDLEEILLTLPFDYVKRLLAVLLIFLERQWDVELMIRSATFLLRVNFGQIAACPDLVPVVSRLRTIMLERAQNLRDCAGFNLAALDHLRREPAIGIPETFGTSVDCS